MNLTSSEMLVGTTITCAGDKIHIQIYKKMASQQMDSFIVFDKH